MTFSLNQPRGPIQSLSRDVRLLFVRAIAENPLPGGLDWSTLGPIQLSYLRSTVQARLFETQQRNKIFK